MADNDFLSGVGGLLNDVAAAPGQLLSSAAAIPAGILGYSANGGGLMGLLNGGMIPQASTPQANTTQPQQGASSGGGIGSFLNNLTSGGIFGGGGVGGITSDPWRMALLQAGIGASQPSPTKAGVWGNAASGFGQGLVNSQDQALKRQLLASEIQKNNQAVLPQVVALVQAGILKPSALQQYLPQGTQMNAPQGQGQGAPTAPQGGVMPGSATQAGITGSPLPAPAGAQNVGYGGGSSSPVNPGAQPNASSQNVAGAAAQPPQQQLTIAEMAQRMGVQVPLTMQGQDKLREDFIARQTEDYKAAIARKAEQDKANLALQTGSQMEQNKKSGEHIANQYGVIRNQGLAGADIANTADTTLQIARNPNFASGFAGDVTQLKNNFRAAFGDKAHEADASPQELAMAMSARETINLLRETSAANEQAGNSGQARVLQTTANKLEDAASNPHQNFSTIVGLLEDTRRRGMRDLDIAKEATGRMSKTGTLGPDFDAWQEDRMNKPLYSKDEQAALRGEIEPPQGSNLPDLRPADVRKAQALGAQGRGQAAVDEANSPPEPGAYMVKGKWFKDIDGKPHRINTNAPTAPAPNVPAASASGGANMPLPMQLMGP